MRNAALIVNVDGIGWPSAKATLLSTPDIQAHQQHRSQRISAMTKRIDTENSLQQRHRRVELRGRRAVPP